MNTTDTAATAHRVRVAALAGELAIAAGLSEANERRVRAAGLHHDRCLKLFNRPALSRLAADVLGEASDDAALIDDAEFELLRAFADPRRITEGVAADVELLRLADALDQAIELGPYRDGPLDADDSPYVAAGIDKLRGGSASELGRIVPRLPVFPAAALAAVTKLTRAEVDRDVIEGVAGSDPVLAGALVSAANSALYAPRYEIRSLARAADHLGCEAAKNILLAAVLRPVFQGAALRPHWLHALEAAEAAAKLAQMSGAMPTGEAALAALVHDIGRLAINMTRPAVQKRCERLVQAGYPSRGAEWLVCGFDHATASGVVLETWRFPASIVAAVRHHHTPEQCDNTLAALLYLVEFWSCEEEDIPSAARLTLAAHHLGVTVEAIIGMKAEPRLSQVFGEVPTPR